jgi:hypothetical protein
MSAAAAWRNSGAGGVWRIRRKLIGGISGASLAALSISASYLAGQPEKENVVINDGIGVEG